MGDYELQELEHTTGLDGHNDGDHNSSNNVLSSIDEDIESAKEIIKQQATLEPLAIKIQGKSFVGKTFTNILIYVCRLFRKAIKDEAIRLVGSSHKQKVLKDLNENSRMLTEIKDRFDPEYPASQQEQKHEFIHYIPLSILLDRANEIAHIIKAFGSHFAGGGPPARWKSCCHYMMG